MAFDIAAIREAVAARIRETGLEAYPFDVQSDIYPRAIVYPGRPFVNYHSTFGPGLVTLRFEVIITANATDPVGAQADLARWLNAGTGVARSVFDALERVTAGDTTPTLHGAVEGIHVEGVEAGPGVNAGTGARYEFAATLSLVVVVRRT